MLNTKEDTTLKKWIGTALAAGLLVQTGLGTITANAEETNTNTGQTQVEQSASDAPDIIGVTGTAIDAYTGKVLYAKDADKEMYPASITKVMTAILIKEHLKKDDVITFSKNAASQEASNEQILYHEGEKMSADDAFESLMIVSSNDVAFAFAEKIGGSVKGFAKMMNEKAKELGATHTHFASPNGLPNPDHYTTAHDMALIAREASKYPDIVKKMGLRKAVIKTNERTVTITSPNIIPQENPKAIGGKTGYTNDAQHTLVEILKDGNKKVIAVTMHSTKQGKYDDMNTMSEYAFKHITKETIPLYEKGEIFHIFEFNGEEYPLMLKEEAVLTAEEGKKKNITQEVEWNTKEKEYKKGETVAWLVIKDGKKEIGKFELQTNKTFKTTAVEKQKKKMSNNGEVGPDYPSNSSKSYIWTFTLIFAIPLLTFFGLNTFINQKRRRSRM
jgi:D-alanyl-D-alanine carboxypeptidase